MTEFQVLQEMFDYDIWANTQWLECLDRKGRPLPELEIFQHLLAAQEIWLERSRGTSLTAMPTPEVTLATLTRLNEGWKQRLSEQSDDYVVEYRRTTGEPQAAPFLKIARHVCNHGTYHRGEIRGLFRARSDADFPDTDYIGYIRLKTG